MGWRWGEWMEVGAGVLVGRQVLISLSLLHLVFVLKISAA